MTDAAGGESVLTVWDSSAEPAPQAGDLYTWNGHAEARHVHSLLGYVEAHADRLRGRYVRWVHDLGEGTHGGPRLIDSLALEGGLSYWWMTLLTEQSPLNSPHMSDALRLLALEEIILERRPRKVRLVSHDRRLDESVSDFCHRGEIAYERVRPADRPARRWSARRLYAALPWSVRALVTLARTVRERWPLRRSAAPDWFPGKKSICFCSYFFNLQAERARAGRFASRYWEGLPERLRASGLRANWLHLYYPHEAVPGAATAIDWTQAFNHQRDQEGVHSFVDAYLSWRVIYRVLRQWCRLNILHRRLVVDQGFRPEGSRLSLWPVMKQDWHNSMRGPMSMLNLLWVELFGMACRDLPRQSQGFYLCENQAWERAFIHAWRKNGHGRLIAVPHTTVRFWDLRYASDPRSLQQSGAYPMPMPDLTALNGRAAVDAFLRAGYPKERMVECEALRYGYLNERPAIRTRVRSPGDPISVLILGDYQAAATTRMLRLLEAAVALGTVPATFTVKPHPSCPVSPTKFPSLQARVVDDLLVDICHDFDVAYASNMTSAAVDAYLIGLPVVVMLDATELNFSPLRGRTGVRFAGTSETLAQALRETALESNGTVPPGAERRDFFFLDPALPRWQALLA